MTTDQPRSRNQPNEIGIVSAALISYYSIETLVVKARSKKTEDGKMAVDKGIERERRNASGKLSVHPFD